MKASRVSILIVDDKQSNVFALEKLLEGSDRIFFSALNGNDALKIALNKNVDLIILDVNMPGMDGFEVAKILQSNKRTSEIPIIFASAEKKEQKSIIKGFEEGAIDYLSKPLDPEITKAKVSVLLKIQMQKKELIEKNIALNKSFLLINNSADIIGIIDEATLKFEEINNAFTTILGFSKEETIGASLNFFLDADDRSKIQQIREGKKERRSFETGVFSKYRTKKWLHWNVVVRDGKWFINARDITEIKLVEKIKNYLATVVMQSDDAIYIHDIEGKIISWNEGARNMYGYSEQEALNMKVWNIVPDYIQDQTQENVQKIMNGLRVDDLETKRITRKGRILDVVFSASLITDSATQQRSVAITERNITSQKISEEKIRKLNLDLQENVEQLKITNNELESFSYSVSHDLRAPLRALDGYAKMIEEDYVAILDDEARRLLGNIQFNARKMGNLIDDLLAFSKLGRKEVQKSKIEMVELVEAALYEINCSVKHKAEIKILNLPSACGDYGLLNQVFVNLISNAIKYSGRKENPSVEIGHLIMNNHVVYYVKDNGDGFNMKYADKLFGIFQRLHSSNDFEGTGIGLAIVQRIILKHGGTVWAEGKVHEGATFYFKLENAG